MLKHTFLHVPGVGTFTERRLWASGFRCWEDYLEGCRRCSLPLYMRERIISQLEASLHALNARDGGYFTGLMPPSEAWRLYREFRGEAAFVDIETTGLYMGANAITVIGLFDGRETKVFVQGINLHQFLGEISRYPLIVTFNGKRFDVPFIEWVLGRLPKTQAHLDLLYPLRRLGYRGGLKSIEAQVGLEREGNLKEVNGFLAVLLWREYRKGNRAALDTLVRYNLEDVVNLQYLADMVHNSSAALLPIDVDLLPSPVRYPLDDLPFDAELVDYLVGRMRGLTP